MISDFRRLLPRAQTQLRSVLWGTFLSLLGPGTVLASTQMAGEIPSPPTTATRPETPGRLIGTVVSAETGEPLAFTNMVLTRLDVDEAGAASEYTAGGAMSMQDGTYRIDVARTGTYKLLVSYIGYQTLVVEGIEMRPDEIKSLDLTLTPRALANAVEEQVVEAKRIESSEVFILRNRKNASAVSDGISSEQISRTTDSNAAEALTRVTGLSVVSGQYVFVRGLGERYSQTQVNGSVVASPETNKRVMPMDMFAASVLENMVVEKTYTPDKPAEFAGGVVNLATRDFPGQKTWSVSMGTGYNASTTGKTFRTYRGGGTDFLGFDDGTRRLPDGIPDDQRVIIGSAFTGGLTADKITQFGRSFEQHWKIEEENFHLPGSMSGSYGNEVEFLGSPLGFLGSLSYSNSFQTSTGEENSYRDESLADFKLFDNVRSSKMSTSWAALSSVAYRFNPANSVTLRGMYNRSADDVLRTWEGEDVRGGVNARNTRFEYVERGVVNASAEFKHFITPLWGSNLEWKLSHAGAERNEPDRRSWIYEEQVPGVWELATRNQPGVRREFGQLEEDTQSFEAAWTLPFRQWSGHEARFQAGTLVSRKDRTFQYRRFGYNVPSAADRTKELHELLTEDTIGASPQTFRLTETTRSSDSYEASHSVDAQFAMVDLPISDRVRVIGGVRLEQSDQTLKSFDIFDPDSLELQQNARIDEHDVAPSLNLVYRLTESVNARAGYSQTVNRPDMRELSPFTFTPYGDTSTEVIGNPDLERATIRNYDARVEYFLGLEELLAASAFYKDFDRPIETSVALRPGGGRFETPINAQSGKLYGAEFEARLAMDRVSDRLSNFGLNANLTLVESKATIGEVLGNVSSEEAPPLVGQSPYVVNVGLFFRSNAGRTEGSVAFNQFGRRLRSVGVNVEGNVTPSIYESPRHRVDVSVSQRVGFFKVKLNAENITDQDAVWKQKDKITERIDHGASFSLSVSTGS